MRHAVFIPSRGRAELMRKSIPAWAHHEIEVWFVVAQEDQHEYSRVMAEEIAAWQKKFESTCRIELHVLNRRVRGMGAIRDNCVTLASSLGCKSLLMSDDDIIPHHTAAPHHTISGVLANKPIGIGCVVSQHDLLLGDEAWRLKESSPIYCSSGYGFRMFALDIAKVEEVGGFDHKLDVCFEDAELMRQGVEGGYSWWLDPLLRAVPLGKRFAPGGIAGMTGSPEEREARTRLCHERVHELWPGFMSSPDKAPRFAWKRFLDHYSPGWYNETFS